MSPIPCAHCGANFMRPTPDPEAPKLCNNCLVREEKRNPTKKESMEQTIDIKITCPIAIHNEIEEYCINNGINLSKYFLSLHETFKNKTEAYEKVKESMFGLSKEEPEVNELASTSTTGMPDKFMKKKPVKK